MTQDDFRKRLHDLMLEAGRDLRLIEIFEVLTSSLHCFTIVYEINIVRSMSQEIKSDE